MTWTDAPRDPPHDEVASQRMAAEAENGHDPHEPVSDDTLARALVAAFVLDARNGKTRHTARPLPEPAIRRALAEAGSEPADDVAITRTATVRLDWARTQVGEVIASYRARFGDDTEALRQVLEGHASELLRERDARTRQQREAERERNRRGGR